MKAAAEGCLTEKDFNDDMRRGLVTESLHRDLLREKLGARVHDHDQEKFIYSEKYGWAHALPDGWVIRNNREETESLDIPVQLKCPRIRGWHEIRLKGVHGYWLLGSQHTLAVTGAPYEIFSVLNVETMRVLDFEVQRDEGLIESLMALEKSFYDNFIARIRPPEQTEPEIELPPSNGELVMIDGDDARSAAMAYLEAAELVNHAEELKKEAEAKVKSLMGAARVAELPGLRAYKTVQNGRVTYDTKAMLKDGLVIDKYEKRGSPFETFRGYRIKS